jgi:xylan 1,4-beta-xylosidase
MHRFRKLTLLTCTVLFLTWPILGQVSHATDIHIDVNAPTTAFPHFWEKTFGSGRAILSLRESYRKDIQTVKDATGFGSVRFHGILMDEVGLYDPDRVIKNPGLSAETVNDASAYNFMYVDQIYDGLLNKGIKPFVELSFMPRKLASKPRQSPSLLLSSGGFAPEGLQALG